MSFPVGAGVMMPDEFDVVRKVYGDISSEKWFTRSESRREQFALAVMETYRRGLVDPKLLKSKCRRVAEIEFGNGGMAY